MRIAFVVSLGLALALGPACGSFDGSDEEARSTAPVRSVKCDEATCTNEDFCCVHGNAPHACTRNCDDVPIACDDAADCTGGLVCCVTVISNGDGSGGLKSSACRAESECQPSAERTGPTRLRACNQFGSDCNGGGCGRLSDRFPTLFPNFDIDVCD